MNKKFIIINIILFCILGIIDIHSQEKDTIRRFAVVAGSNNGGPGRIKLSGHDSISSHSASYSNNILRSSHDIVFMKAVSVKSREWNISLFSSCILMIGPGAQR